MIYIVMGMHKSGTTLAAQLLHQAGIPMVRHTPANGHYAVNKYERPEMVELNLELLGCRSDLESISCAPPPRLHISDQAVRQAQVLIAEFEQSHEHWGFKDPRASLTYRFWAQRLPEHRIIVMIRSLNELWQRYSSVNIRRRILGLRTAWNLVQRWHEYNFTILDNLRASSHAILVLDYRKVMNDDQPLSQMAEFVGVDLPDLRKSGSYRPRTIKYSLWLDLAIRSAQRRWILSPAEVMKAVSELGSQTAR